MSSITDKITEVSETITYKVKNLGLVRTLEIVSGVVAFIGAALITFSPDDTQDSDILYVNSAEVVNDNESVNEVSE